MLLKVVPPLKKPLPDVLICSELSPTSLDIEGGKTTASTAAATQAMTDDQVQLMDNSAGHQQCPHHHQVSLLEVQTDVVLVMSGDHTMRGLREMASIDRMTVAA